MPKISEDVLAAQAKRREEVREYLQAHRALRQTPRFVIKNSRAEGGQPEYYSHTDIVNMVGVHHWVPLDKARTFVTLEDASRVKRGFRNAKHRMYGNIVPIEKEKVNQ